MVKREREEACNFAGGDGCRCNTCTQTNPEAVFQLTCPVAANTFDVRAPREVPASTSFWSDMAAQLRQEYQEQGEGAFGSYWKASSVP